MVNHPLPEDRFPFLNKAILQIKINWSIRLRWMAIIGFLFATLIARSFFSLEIPFQKVWSLLGLLGCVNLVYFIILKVHRHFAFREELYFLFIHIIVDLIVLTSLINLTGGVENPMYLFFIFHIVLSSILFPRPIPYYIATFVVVLFISLVVGENIQLFTHHCIFHADLHDNIAFSVLVLVVFTLAIYITTYIATSFVWIFRKSKREIDLLNRDLVRSDEEKARFFRFTSHELKSPLIAVKTSIDSITKTSVEQLDPRALSILQRASERCNQMLEIIRELLALSGLRGNQGLPERKQLKFDIVKVVQEVIENNQPIAEARHIQISKDFTPSTILLWGNPDDFKQVFGNLIGNALRYNWDGGEVRVSLQVSGDTWLKILIDDTGIGIPKAEQAYIFDEFYRAGNARQKIQFGTGLGLSLVRQIILNYAGRIEVESTEDKGTTFNIVLPIKENLGSENKKDISWK